MPLRTISVIGSSEADEKTLKLADSVGQEIARRGVALVCGGLGGVMEAACRGAKRRNGVTIGLLPSDNKKDANQFVDIVIPTGFGYARNFLVARTGDAIIAIGGQAGTLSEMAIGWFSEKPVVAMVHSGGWAQRLAGSRIDDKRQDLVASAETPEQAVDAVFKALGWK
ncbi:MAG: TIGR00725 family protein [Candidatus Thorarchaeota archaeon]|nr:MAG: TIGR00725 family protein [Candidatus Thorarchaeota archaeon]